MANIRTIQRMYVIGMQKNGTEENFKVLMEVEKVDADTKKSTFNYNSSIMKRNELMQYIHKHNGLAQNISLVGSTGLKGTQGGLDRYDVAKNKKVIVILGEVRNINKPDELLGYRVATSDGKVERQLASNVIKYCVSVSQNNGVPIANAQFVRTKDKKPFLRSYMASGFPVEYIAVNRQNTHSKKADINTKQATKAVNKLEELFSKEQIAELKQAKVSGVDIRVIANNKLSPKQMHIIWECEAESLPGRLFADPAYSLDSMEFFRAELETGADISHMLNPKYSTGQLFELSLGYEQGVDISKYANPKNSVEVMRKTRESMANKVWKEFKIHTGLSGKNKPKAEGE